MAIDSNIVPCPFHESVVIAIRAASTREELDFLGYLIRWTLIPKNHDAIITVLKRRMTDMGIADMEGVLEHIESQRTQPTGRVITSRRGALASALTKIRDRKGSSYPATNLVDSPSAESATV